MTDWCPLAGGAWKLTAGRRRLIALVFPYRPRGMNGPRIWEWRTGRYWGDGRRGYALTFEAAKVLGERAARGEP